MTTYRKIAQWALLLALILMLGSLGFVWVEGWNFFDALYMTVTTLTTVGYGEVHPLDRAGRIYNIFLILAGMGLMLYIVSALARVVVEGELRTVLGKRKLTKKIEKITDHYILCGFGRIGEIIARELREAGIPLVVVESNPVHLAHLEEGGYFFLAGDATREEVLLEAGIGRAKGLVSVVGSDIDNVYVTLTARSLNPKLFIVARAEERGSEKKLIRAGANRVESPYEMGGRKMVQTILRPTVVTFMELAMEEGVAWSMEEVVVKPGSDLVGKTMKDSGIRQRFDLIIVAIKRLNGEQLFNPTPGSQVLAGDTLIAIGLRHNLDDLERCCSGLAAL